MMMMNKSIVVVGCGSIGQRHIRNLAEVGVDEIIGVDHDEQMLNEAKKSGADLTYSDLAPAIQKNNIDAGFVCVPNHLHIQIASQLADNGIDLFIEKPLSHTMDGVTGLISKTKENDLISLVGCNLRFHPGIQTIKELLDRDAIGKTVSVKIEAGSYLPGWHPDDDYKNMYSARENEGGGAILDFIHEIDYARWLFGDVSSVSAMAGTYSDLELETEDLGAMLLEFENDLIGELHVDYVQRSYSRSCKVIGTNGTLYWEWQQGSVEEFDPEAEQWVSHRLPEWTMNDMYIDETRHFLQSIENRDETISGLESGKSALEIALAAKRSNTEGRRVSVESMN
jgi:predicted dehydrogenase